MKAKDSGKTITVTLPIEAAEWLHKGEKGTSSETMFGAISGLKIYYRQSHPSDPDDFRRCYLLIKQVPQWRNELHKVAALSNTWFNIVENWDKLCEMMEEKMNAWSRGEKSDRKMYEFMKSLESNP